MNDRWRYPFVGMDWFKLNGVELDPHYHLRPVGWHRVDVSDEKRLGFDKDMDQATIWANERHAWILDNIQNPIYTTNSISFWFKDPADAVLFKLWMN